MRIYTAGLHSYLPNRVHDALGLPAHVRQGRVLVAAGTKAQAFRLLAERRIAPDSIRDPEFRQAMGNDMDELARVGLLDAPIVLAMEMQSHRTKVVRVDPDTTVVLGTLEPAPGYKVRFVPTPEGVGGLVPAVPMGFPALAELVSKRYRVTLFDAGELVEDAVRSAAATRSPASIGRLNQVMPAEIPDLLREIENELELRDQRQESANIAAAKTTGAELVVMALAANRKRVEEVNAELARLRRERQEFAHRARELDVIAEAALTLGVSPARVSQLGDEYLVALARERNEFRPGVWVELQVSGRDPANCPRVQVVEKPADMLPPNDTEPWVWVHTNDNTFPVRRSRVLAWVPPCSVCPPEEQMTIHTGADLTVHQAARHQ